MILASNVALFNEHAEIEETVEDGMLSPDTMRHLVRRSLSTKQHLRLFPQKLEFDDQTVKRTQIDKKGREVHTTDPSSRVVWKSDRTLLSTQKVEQMPQDFTRVTSKSKRRRWEPELPATVETPVDPELDNLPDSE